MYDTGVDSGRPNPPPGSGIHLDDSQPGGCWPLLGSALGVPRGIKGDWGNSGLHSKLGETGGRLGKEFRGFRGCKPIKPPALGGEQPTGPTPAVDPRRFHLEVLTSVQGRNLSPDLPTSMIFATSGWLTTKWGLINVSKHLASSGVLKRNHAMLPTRS